MGGWGGGGSRDLRACNFLSTIMSYVAAGREREGCNSAPEIAGLAARQIL